MEVEGLELKPCPFCGGGVFLVHKEGQVWTNVGFPKPQFVSIRHWCHRVPELPSPTMIEKMARDLKTAVDMWNERYGGEDNNGRLL